MSYKKLLRHGAVRENTGWSTSAIYAAMAEGTFPKPLKIGKRAVAWVEAEVDEWIERRLAERDSGACR